ncbi:family 20 glycosylhydrolase [Streptomyces sp. So13.3]|uniref:family 20 glycosylhydrolase n=1 Tax=Streptomyces TaxID=1883 RepID=UPI00110727CD|nr:MULTISPECIES: family 20 glycosylhydrolase [Streptomyces]MCZ4101965.1 family 20 glycosylhydrolase [Streptomyces sp. H39-C1]QNA75607.1 family 20 glycosylhydrolase [Streptomyces sp. So13.3]
MRFSPHARFSRGPAAVLGVLFGLLLALAVPLAQGPAHAAGAVPRTIPALQQWTAGSGAYTFGPASRVVADSAYSSALGTTGRVFADDLTQLTGRTVTLVSGPASAVRPGDLFLTLGSTDTTLGTEGYALTVGSSVTVRARADAGAFYGTRSVLQLLKQSPTIAAGTARDWPAKAERGLMVDVGRKYFTVPWLQGQIRDLAYLKMNYFHLHLSDTYGFRLESTSHPEITSAAHYTKREITDLIALGARYHVTVVPEIDVPGHMNTTLTAHPELRLVNSAGTPSNQYIDLSNPAAYTLIQDLITEYLPLFPAKYWHLGADEYVTNYASYPQLLSYARAHYGPAATAKDVYYGFVNWADGIVRAGGKTMRMWNDGIKQGDGTITPNADITVDYWFNYGLTPQQLVAAGHTVMNSSWTPTYYVYGGDKPNTPYMYETWNPEIFQGGTTLTDPSRNRGSVLHVWCDNPNAETEQQTAAGIMTPMRALAQQTWGSPGLVPTLAEFQPIVTTVGRPPGWPTDTAAGDLALGRPVTVSSTETPAFPAEGAVDGSYASRWSSAYSDPQWLRIDLGSSRAVNRVKLTWETAHATAFQIQLSDDGTSWSTVYSTTSASGGTQNLTGLSGSGRYLRIYLTRRGTVYGYSLWEVEAYHDA